MSARERITEVRRSMEVDPHEDLQSEVTALRFAMERLIDLIEEMLHDQAPKPDQAPEGGQP